MKNFDSLVWTEFQKLYSKDVLAGIYKQINEFSLETQGLVPGTTDFDERGNLEVPKNSKPLYFFA